MGTSFAVAAVVIVIGLALRVGHGTRARYRRRVKCPRSGEPCDIDVQHQIGGWRPLAIRVVFCSELPEPTRVTCDQACIQV